MTDQRRSPPHDNNTADIDWSVLDTFGTLRKPGGPDPRARLIRVFLDSSPDLLRTMKKSFEKADADTLAKTAHSMKSGSMNVGATGLASLCARLEKLGGKGAADTIGNLLEETEKQYNAVASAFSARLSEIEL